LSLDIDDPPQPGQTLLEGRFVFCRHVLGDKLFNGNDEARKYRPIELRTSPLHPVKARVAVWVKSWASHSRMKDRPEPGRARSTTAQRSILYFIFRRSTI